ncbi:cysteine hydrolase family protein [Tundrisphaera sp. TA3]|uniref:cysteine hydrolase family protein n=1 Tax=Tundrisphaera sp. TA3 TaxID=3435775 RepID=UPI003EB759D4
MLEGPLVFVDVDTQRDFLDPDGVLWIAGSEAIRPNLARLTRFARDRGIPVLATACDHAPDDEEFATFPPHCLSGTPGQERVEETAWPDSRVLTSGGPVPEAPVPHLTIPKQQYDVFSRPDLPRVLEVYGRDRPTFVVYGVATDYCVACAVDGLLRHGHRVAVVVDAVRAVEPEAEAEHLTGFADRGALLTITDVVCGD